MELPHFSVVDLETSGVRVERHRILQIALVKVDATGAVLDEWETYIKLRWPLARVGPTHVHGIRRSTLRGAPRIDAVLSELSSRIGDSLFVAHNAQFDGEFLLRAAARLPDSDRPPTSSFERRLCTLRMSRRLDPNREQSHRLLDVCHRYAVALDRPHEALADARATAAVLPHLLRAHDITAPAQLEPFLDRDRPA